MKIIELNLIAFGPFTNTVLNLSEGKEGLHLIYGPNEAGKSSALRALRQMLYGIPQRSTDNFLHPYNKLRIGARLRHSDGTEIEFIRRKGHTKTLRAADDKTLLDNASLTRFLNGVHESLFETMFGIGHEELVRGGEEIVNGGGNIGQALFTAGAGILRLRRVREGLQAEAGELFKPSAQKPVINKTIAEIRETQKALRAAELSGPTWLQHEKALRDAEKRINVLAAELEHRQQERHRLERIRKALPLIAKRKELQKAYTEFADAPILPEDFGESRRDMVTTLRTAENQRDQALKSIETIRAQIQGIEIPGNLIPYAEEIQDIQQVLGSYRKAAQDRPNLETRMSVMRKEAATILAGLRDDLTLDEAERLHLKRAEVSMIQRLGKMYERLTAKLDAAKENERKLTIQLKALKERKEGLPTPIDVAPLKAAWNTLVKAGPLEKQHRLAFKELDEIQEGVEIALKQQTLWKGALEALTSLPVPSNASIDAFEKRFDTLSSHTGRLQADRERIANESARIASELKEIELSHPVPTEQDLQTARKLRDQGWHLIRGVLESSPLPEDQRRDFLDRFSGKENLPDAFETSLKQTDEIADRLRREADRVSRKAALLARRAQYETELTDLTQHITAIQKETRIAEEEWRRLWDPAGIAPLSPREMRAWAADIQALKEKYADVRKKKTTVEAIEARINDLRKTLFPLLHSVSESKMDRRAPLADLAAASQRIINQQEKYQSQTETLASNIGDREAEQADIQSKIDHLERQLGAWRNDWASAVRPLGLNAGAEPTVANEVLSGMRDLREKLKEADILRKRIDGIDRDAGAFAKRVRELTHAVAPELEATLPERAAVELNARLTKARENLSKLRTHETQLRQVEELRQESESRITLINAQLADLYREAGCSNIAQLPDAEKRSHKRQQLESELTGLEERLRDLSAGATVDDFAEEALSVDPDGIETMLQQMDQEIDTHKKERSELDQTIGQQKTELRRMDGSARAAELAETAQRMLGRLDTDIEHYARLRLASAVLNGAIERYRKKNQGPLLERAGVLFSQMTLGAFKGIRAEYDEKGNPILVGVRPASTELVRVEGMSDGSADQLYFALRLAGLERYLAKNEPMPFVIDDVLIRFDDDRAKSSLKVLSDLSRHTQVIFFTHHQHLVELAAENVDPSVLVLHTLNDAKST